MTIEAATLGGKMRRLIPVTLTIALLFTACSDSSDDPIQVVHAADVEKGSIAPDFTLLNPDGDPISLSDFRGKIVYLEFWASWCPYCLAAMPGLVDIWEDYRSENFVILGVSIDYRERDWKEYLSEHSDVNWPQVFDPLKSSSAPAQVYGLTGTPNSFLIDEEGIVRKVFRSSVGEQVVRNEIDLLLAE